MKGKKTGGRSAGTPNKVSKAIREMLTDSLKDHVNRIPQYLDNLDDDKDRLDAITKLLPYVAPKVREAPKSAVGMFTFGQDFSGIDDD